MRQLLLLLTIIVIASACGASTDTAALEERIAELEAQLNEEQNEPNQTQAPQDPATDQTTTPNTVPQVAEQRNETQGDSQSLVQETPEVAAPIEKAFAEPNGAVLQDAFTPADLRPIVQPLIGPHDNLAGTLARIAPFPDIPTLPDTSLRQVLIEVENVLRGDGSARGYNQRNFIVGDTSTSITETELTISTALAAAGFPSDDNRSTTASRVRFSHGQNFADGRFTIELIEQDNGRTRFQYSYNFETEIPQADFVAASATWGTQGINFGNGRFQGIEINVDTSSDLFDVSIIHLYDDSTSPEQLEAQLEASLDPEIWSTGQAPVTSETRYVYLDEPGFFDLNIFTSAASTTTTQTFTYRGSR